MSTEIANRVPGLAGLAAGLRRTKQTMPSFGGKPYLTFGKDGGWTLGTDKRTTHNGRSIIVNITTLKSGFICWTNYPAAEKRKNEKLGEEMRQITAEPIDITKLPDLGWEWKQQQYFEARFTDGDREELSFSTSSMGGLEAMDGLMTEIMDRVESGEDVYLFPVVLIENDFYDHRQYGKTYKPIFEIIGWADADGVFEGEQHETKKPDAIGGSPASGRREDPEEQAQDEGDDAPIRRRRR